MNVRLFFVAILSIATIFLPAIPGPQSGTVPLTVLVKNIERGKGNIDIAVFNNEETFLKAPMDSDIVAASGDSLEFTFRLSKGTYAIAAYQDLNSDHKLDRGWFGIPTEPYGLSTNFRPMFSKPTFDDCKFILTAPMRIAIYLK